MTRGPIRRSIRAAILAATANACGETPALVEREVGDAPACADVGAWSEALTAREERLLERLAAARIAGGSCGDDGFDPAPPLAIVPELRCAARLRAIDELEGTLDHEHGDETALDRLRQAEYAGLARAELLAADYVEPDEVSAAWLANVADCAALRDGDIDHAGAGMAVSRDGSRTAWVLFTGEDR